MLEGEMDYGYAGATYHLAPGDALQIDGEVAHGPVRLISLPVRFLSVIAYGQPVSVEQPSGPIGRGRGASR
jgi:hypothetical protein